MRKKSFHHGGTIFSPRWNDISAMMERFFFHIFFLFNKGLCDIEKKKKVC